MISDEDIQRALDWMVSNTDKAAKARADRVYMEGAEKSLVAKLMKQSSASAVEAQKRDAHASDEYQTFMDGLRAAVHEDEKYRLLYKAAEARIEAWRTLSSNARAVGKVQ